MSDDKAALAALLESSIPGTAHVVRHYLYFPTEDSAGRVAVALRHGGFSIEERLGADEVNWLVLARHEIVPSEELIAATRQVMESLAARNGGEYDGWEAEVHK